jgi:hypothetical protein
MDLQDSWNITRLYLDNARNLLPSPLKDESKGRGIEAYEEWLSSNELGLAFDELEMLGEANSCSREFWQELLAAAENMGLVEPAERCRARLSLK